MIAHFNNCQFSSANSRVVDFSCIRFAHIAIHLKLVLFAAIPDVILMVVHKFDRILSIMRMRRTIFGNLFFSEPSEVSLDMAQQ